MVKIGSANLYGVCINLALTIRSNEAGGLRWIFALAVWLILVQLELFELFAFWLHSLVCRYNLVLFGFLDGFLLPTYVVFPLQFGNTCIGFTF